MKGNVIDEASKSLTQETQAHEKMSMLYYLQHSDMLKVNKAQL